MDEVEDMKDRVYGLFHAALCRELANISSVHIFENGMVMTFDVAGAQMPAFQGVKHEIIPMLRVLGWEGEAIPSEIAARVGDEA